MAIEKLSTSYKDDILDTSVNTKRRYQMTNVSDDTYEITDVSTYTQVGTDYKAIDVNETNDTVNSLIDIAEASQTSIFGMLDGSIVPPKATYSETAGTLENDIILQSGMSLTFVDNVCTISDSRITADSLVDVYFADGTYESANMADISVESQDGSVVLTAKTTPTETLIATIRVRVI